MTSIPTTALDGIREAGKHALALDVEHGSSPHMDGTFVYRLRVPGKPGIRNSIRLDQSTAELFAAVPRLLAAVEAVLNLAADDAPAGQHYRDAISHALEGGKA